MTRDEAAELIRNSDLAPFADSIIAKLRPSIFVNAERVSFDELPLGASRIGGVPDVPEDFVWPQWMGRRLQWNPAERKSIRTEPEEKALHFVAQLSLAELPRIQADHALPTEGTLYFFYDVDIQPWGYDPNDHLGARVVYSPKVNERLKRQAHPSPDPSWESFPCKLRFQTEWTIPDWEHYGVRFSDIWDANPELRQAISANPENGGAVVHRVLGWPETVQGDMQLECQLVANGIYCGGESGYKSQRAKMLEAGAQDWTLLLQIDTDEAGPGWMWGDCGRIYYWIRKEDLKQRRFENIRLILQCS